jgi:septum formation protein
VITGVCVVAGGGARVELASATTLVTMRTWSESEIEDYVASGECFDKAGAYAIQETADRFVVRLEGSRSNVVGLPLEVVAPMLAAAGVAVRSPA